MPRYEFFCNDCKKLFSTVLSLVDYAAGEVLCPRCGSHDRAVLVGLQRHHSKKSA